MTVPQKNQMTEEYQTRVNKLKRWCWYRTLHNLKAQTRQTCTTKTLWNRNETNQLPQPEHMAVMTEATLKQEYNGTDIR